MHMHITNLPIYPSKNIPANLLVIIILLIPISLFNYHTLLPSLHPPNYSYYPASSTEPKTPPRLMDTIINIITYPRSRSRSPKLIFH